MDNNINDLINLLNNKIEEINREEQFLKDSYLYIDIYKQLFSYLNTDDYNEIMDNNIYINMLLEILYKKEDARKIDESIYISSYQIINYRKNEYYEEDINYINYLKEFKNNINKLNNEYNLLLNKQDSLLKEKDNRNKLHECYNRLLFCFKNNININDNDIIVINKLLEEYNYNNLDIKIIIENINLYNSKINKQDNININKIDEVILSTKGYFEFIATKNQQEEAILRFNIDCLRNNYKFNDLLIMDLCYYGIRVGNATRKSIRAENELNKKEEILTKEELFDESSKNGDEEKLLPIYDIIIEGVKND